MKYLRIFISIFAIIASLLFANPALASGDSTLTGVVNTSNPSSPYLTLMNTADQPCQVANTAVGTVSVTEVGQKDNLVEPSLLTVAYDEAMPDFLRTKLKTLQSGESIRIPLNIIETSGKLTLESIAWSEETGAYGLAYAIDASQQLNISLTYNVPLDSSKDDIPLCGLAVAKTDNKGLSGGIIFWIIAVAVLILLVLLVVWFLRRKRSKAIVAAILIFISSPFFVASFTKAEYTMPDSVRSQFDACLAILEENNDITGEVLTTLNMGDIEIRPNNDGRNDTVDYREFGEGIVIYWDPNNTHEYAGTGGTSDPCTSLYHEMYHAHEMMWGTIDLHQCGSTGIRISEVNATRAQNELRARLGMPTRSHYGPYPLPVGDCTDPPEPEPCEGNGCGETNGDPHLRTFDGLRYDFQAAGEFTLVKSTEGNDFNVQVRQTPWPNSRQVSVNQAVVAKVGNDVVEFVMKERKLNLLINGQPSKIENKEVDAGKIVAGNRLTQVIWRDNSKLTVRSIGTYGIQIIVDPANSRQSKLEGLLGNFDNNKDNDLRLKEQSKVIEAEFEQLYPEFADSWRISNEDSFFAYQNNENTETFTDKTFPDAKTDANSLPGRTAAKTLCERQGITEPTVLENCILDVALTGQPEFAYIAEVGQEVTKYDDYGGKTWQLEIREPDKTAKVEFDAKSGDKIFIDAFNATLSDQCGVLLLRDPDGRLLNNGCLKDGRGFIDGTNLEKDGKYTIVVDPSGDRTGKVTLRMFPINDQISKIIPDGKSTKAYIERPGEVARLNFTGKTGQRVFVDASNVTLPDQCGAIALRSPASQLAIGCTGDGRGFIDTQVLPVDGEYSVVVDPGARRTGSADIKVILATSEVKSISVNGQAETINLSKPGSQATFTFDGKSGERIVVEVLSTTLTNQCGVLILRDPDDSQVASGCITNGGGGLDKNGIILSKNGQYKFIVNPVDRRAGEVSVKITR